MGTYGLNSDFRIGRRPPGCSVTPRGTRVTAGRSRPPRANNCAPEQDRLLVLEVAEIADELDATEAWVDALEGAFGEAAGRIGNNNTDQIDIGAVKVTRAGLAQIGASLDRLEAWLDSLEECDCELSTTG